MDHKQKHILIVEDSPDLQALLSQFFMAEGYKTSRASNGQQALDLLHSMSDLPSVILLDIMMPMMDGLEFRDEQKRNLDISKIPVIVMTADANFQSKAEKMGAADFVRKPIEDIDDLLMRVERLHVAQPPEIGL